MTSDKYIVVSVGLGLIISIWWFFFGKDDESSVASGKISIKVSGGYKPSTIKIKIGEPVVLSVTRTENNSCLEEIIIPDFKISEYLPLNKTVDIKINPTKLGEFKFHCGMNMYHGKIVVV